MSVTIIISACCLLMMSCNAQTDLRSIPYDKDLASVVSAVKNMERDREQETTMLAYRTDNVDKFRINNISLTNHTFDNVSYEETNRLYLLVDNYQANNFVGYVVKIVDEEKSEELITFFKKKLGDADKIHEYVRREENYADVLYLWNRGEITFIKQHTENRTNQRTGKVEKFTTTTFINIKRGLVLTPDSNNNPENIENILRENPNAFDLIEVFKSQFPQH